MDYQKKYLKYKLKYLNTKKTLKGGGIWDYIFGSAKTPEEIQKEDEKAKKERREAQKQFDSYFRFR
tara:strand:- start:869 stop:1066 length:198 start_codon:yes stop_codon:yes gene_type:complete